MSDKKDIKVHTSSVLEIIRVDNGYAVYVSFGGYWGERKAVPLVVFSSKNDLVEWLNYNWRDEPLKQENTA